MGLNIETFSSVKGGQSFFKAIGHPLAAQKASILIEALQAYQNLAIYDPEGYLSSFAELYNLSSLKISAVYVQRYEHLGRLVLGHQTRLISELTACDALFIVAFDGTIKLQQIRSYLPPKCSIHTLDEIRIDSQLLTNSKHYLDPLNFATNFAFFRDQEGFYTRLVTANYWSVYSERPASLWCLLLNEQGETLANWTQDLGVASASIVLDSREIRQRFKLPEFCGQLFLHVVGAAGHDIVKYALDIFCKENKSLSCTHDANAWPADLYAGVPAPQEDEDVILWVQNSHPCPIPSGAIGLNLMGNSSIIWWPESVSAFGSKALSISKLLPHIKWPQQLEVQAGKHFVRPRYEVFKKQSGRRYIAHANVERTDLKPDPELKKLSAYFGKGFILPAPLLPLDEWRSIVLPTPMATIQQSLPLALGVYDAQGKNLLQEKLGNLLRADSHAIDVTALLTKCNIKLPEGSYGHFELMYDFETEEKIETDGWLHGLFRYERYKIAHTAETSFGGHMFNLAVTYKNQPMSYKGTPPGLSTRLFLRLGDTSFDTHCHLIYPTSKTWHPYSSTELQLINGIGKIIVSKPLKIACGGSFYWRVQEQFTPQELREAGENAYIIIRDETCRLFGYHGLITAEGHFSLDHMFGF